MESTNFLTAIALFRSEAAKLRSDDDWSGLLGLFRAKEDNALPVDLLLLKAAAIQLAEDSHGYTLTDAKYALEVAREVDPFGTRSLIEMGYFQFAVEDDARASLQTFDEVANECENNLIDAICGKAKVLKELSGAQAALEYLRGVNIRNNEVIQALVLDFSMDD